AAQTWLGHKPGGVAMAAVGACAGFGAVCGSSLATAATMGKVALPELKRYGYSDALATGALAAGGTLGILIPPSVILVIFAILAQVNVAKLFVAAIIPGVIAALGYMLVIRIYVHFSPKSAGSAPREPYNVRFKALLDIWPVLLIFTLVIGGIYSGVFTPTEGAAIGALGTGLIAVFSGKLNFSALNNAILETASVSAMIFLIIFGAAVLNGFLALSGAPQAMAMFISEQGFSPWLVLIAILLLYLVLGTLMDSLSMILLTIPIFYPIVTQLDFGLSPAEFALWFGVLVLVVVEVGLITPPVGLNLFVIHKMSADTKLSKTNYGVLPFVVSDIFRIALLLAFPAISLFLSRLFS
ncbi:TRAP dicarboxylate transporter, DctM subunit, unknown substrate 3, partial [hydrothermal vent metagenome]